MSETSDGSAALPRPTHYIDINWNDGSPTVEPATVYKNQKVEWKGDKDVADFTVILDEWPFHGSERTLTPGDPGDKTKKGGSYGYRCKVWGSDGGEGSEPFIQPIIVIRNTE